MGYILFVINYSQTLLSGSCVTVNIKLVYDYIHKLWNIYVNDSCKNRAGCWLWAIHSIYTPLYGSLFLRGLWILHNFRGVASRAYLRGHFREIMDKNFCGSVAFCGIVVVALWHTVAFCGTTVGFCGSVAFCAGSVILWHSGILWLYGILWQCGAFCGTVVFCGIGILAFVINSQLEALELHFLQLVLVLKCISFWHSNLPYFKKSMCCQMVVPNESYRVWR